MPNSDGIIVDAGGVDLTPADAGQSSVDVPSLIQLVKAVIPFFRSGAEDELRLRKLQLEVSILESQAGIHGAAPVPADVGLRGLNRVNVVIGSQHSGKSHFMRRAAEFAHSFGTLIYWWEPRFVTKPLRLDFALEWLPGTRVPPGSVIFVDEAWKLYETGEVKDDEWLRSLYHSENVVWLTAQNGGFLAPKIWKSGAIAVYCTGSDGVGHRFEREEVADIFATLNRHAVARKTVSAFSGGSFYEFQID